MWVQIPLIYTTLCDKVCQSLPGGRWFSPSTPVYSTNKSDVHDITELFLEVALNTKHNGANINRNTTLKRLMWCFALSK